MSASFDRTTQDTGNIVALEHVNLTQPDQQIATLFFIMGLGLTRDPYMTVGVDNMWINIGRSQLHMPTQQPQHLQGVIGLVLPDLAALKQRLELVAPRLAGTRFSVRNGADGVDVTCPWGNHFRCHAPDARFGAMNLGLAYVEFDVAPGNAEGIARFYQEAFRARAHVEQRQGTTVAHVGASHQRMTFRETSEPLIPYDGHHVQIYISDFAAPHRFLSERGLITSEDSQHQYRFVDIVDPRSGKVLHKVEHEVRSMLHPLYGRPLINRNPAQALGRYVKGQESYYGPY